MAPAAAAQGEDEKQDENDGQHLLDLAIEGVAGNRFRSRLYCSPKALWKLNWFLRDFGYDSELLGRDEIDDRNLVGLSGVVNISHAVVNGSSLLNLEAFAPASQWQVLSSDIRSQISGDARAAS